MPRKKWSVYPWSLRLSVEREVLPVIICLQILTGGVGSFR